MNKTSIMLKTSLPISNKSIVCVIGLGYVGLPLAVQISKTKKSFSNKLKLSRKVIGYDINTTRINELKSGIDSTLELKKKELKTVLNNKSLIVTNELKDIRNAEIFIITVPTPIDKEKKPDLSLIKNASEIVGKCLGKRKISKIPIVIFESTVYPGATEEVCIPIIEKHSGMKLNNKNKNNCFYCGYSPERINPGDKKHKISDIKKITSGSNKVASKWVNSFYESFIKAGTHLAPSIKVAEAAKIIENTQRDLNIALVNELSIIFSKMNIDTLDIIEAAASKWNFIKFYPGLVGGHCIGVDPYYLTYKSEKLGYKPEIVLAGRKINDNMSDFLLGKILSELSKNNIKINQCKILILGVTFKENCPDIRNSKIFELIKSLSHYNKNFHVVDPWIDKEIVKSIYDLDVKSSIDVNGKYDVILSLVKHKEFVLKKVPFWKSVLKKNHLIFDLKGYMPRSLNTLRI